MSGIVFCFRVSWGVITAFTASWLLLLFISLIPLSIPGPAVLPAILRVVPTAIFRTVYYGTLLAIFLMYLKLIMAIIFQIALPIAVLLETVPNRAIRNLGWTIEGAFWGLLIGTLLGALMTRIVAAMWINAFTLAGKAITMILSGIGGVLTGLGNYIKCALFGWLFHCSPNISMITRPAHVIVRGVRSTNTDTTSNRDNIHGISRNIHTMRPSNILLLEKIHTNSIRRYDNSKRTRYLSTCRIVNAGSKRKTDEIY